MPAGRPRPSRRSFYRLEAARLVPCEPNEAQIIGYISPTIDDEAELQEQYNIDYHTLQSSLDPDELSRLEIEPDHAAIIFKRPKSFCAGDNFLMKLTSTGIFVYENYLVIVMADDSPIFEGRVPFPVQSIHDVILRLLYQATMHFEGHLKAINMLADSLERRINTSLENKYLLNMFALEKSLVFILNSITSNGALLERMKTLSEKLGFNSDQAGDSRGSHHRKSAVLPARGDSHPGPRQPHGDAGIHRRPQPEPTHQEVHHLDGGNNACESRHRTLLDERRPASSHGGCQLAVRGSSTFMALIAGGSSSCSRRMKKW